MNRQDFLSGIMFVNCKLDKTFHYNSKIDSIYIVTDFGGSLFYGSVVYIGVFCAVIELIGNGRYISEVISFESCYIVE